MQAFKNISSEMRKVLSINLDNNTAFLESILYDKEHEKNREWYNAYIHGMKETLRLLGYKYISRKTGGYLVKI